MEVEHSVKILIFLYLNGDRGLEVLKSLIINGYKNIEVFCDKKNALIEGFCSKNNLLLNLSTEVNSNNHLSYIKKRKPYLSIVAGFSQIFSNKIIDLPSQGTINLHAGPVPKYRGGSPLNWQIINGEKKIGVSLIKMDEGIDSGDLIELKYFSLLKNEDIKDVHNKANKIFSILVLNVLGNLKNKSINFTKQNEENVGYWHQRQDRDGLINWDRMSSAQIYNFVRALTSPYKGAYTYFKGKKVRILKTNLIKESFFGTPGRIIKKQKNIIIICSDKGILIENYFIESHKGDLINGSYLTSK